jgi:hypothetical protein
MATLKKRKMQEQTLTQTSEVQITEDNIADQTVLKLSYALTPILTEIHRQLNAQNELSMNLSNKIDKLNLQICNKMSKLEAQFCKLEKEIADMQIHILHGSFSGNQSAMVEQPYYHY